MKGIVFTEFLEMVEQRFGYETADKLLTQSGLKSGGAYTAVGTYEFGEMVKLLTKLSEETGIEISVLLKEYGLYFFGALKKGYPQFLERTTSAFDFLESIENHIHVEVRKLYPDAELPTFETKKTTENSMEMIYRSERRMSDFAEGLIEKALEHFGESATVSKENLEETGSIVKFLIVRNEKNS